MWWWWGRVGGTGGSEDYRVLVLEAGDMRSGRGLKAVRLWESYLEVVMRGKEGTCILSTCPVMPGLQKEQWPFGQSPGKALTSGDIPASIKAVKPKECEEETQK